MWTQIFKRLSPTPVKVISGRQATKERVKRWFSRRKFGILLLIASVMLPALLMYAVYDFVTTAKLKEDAAQSAGLRSELAQFVLNLQENDEYALLENPVTLSHTARKLAPVIIRKPFFSFFLNRENAKTFDSNLLAWDMPSACELDFPASSIPTEDQQIEPIRVCIAEVPNDPVGHYLYFSIRYQTDPIVRHNRGKALADADRISLEFESDRIQKLDLVFEPVEFATERYPSQKRRFLSLHTVTGYTVAEGGHPTRSISGQAFERLLDDGKGGKKNYLTAFIRIDASLISSTPNVPFSSSTGSRLITSIHGFHPTVLNGISQQNLFFQIGRDQEGTSLISIEKLYNLYISSKSELQIYKGNSLKEMIWNSDQIGNKKNVIHAGWFQLLSDKWASLIGHLFGFNLEPKTADQQIPSENVKLILKGGNAALPDIATRTFLFLSLTLILVFLLIFAVTAVLSQFMQITKVAYALTTSPTSTTSSLSKYRKRTDQMGALGRTFELLIRRHRSRNKRLVARAERDAKAQKELARIELEQVKTRNAILDAIGHEIRSPLNNLISGKNQNPETTRDLNRMVRAVDALYTANSVEAGLKKGIYQIVQNDLAEFLFKYVANTSERITGIRYHGLDSGVFAAFDDVMLSQILDHLLDNARRYRVSGGEIGITLIELADNLQIDFFNVGPNIPDEQIEFVFELGISSGEDDRNIGQGLFASRIYVSAMKGAISAVNRSDGVSFIIEFPKL